MKNKLNIVLFISLFCLVSCKSLTQKKVETVVDNVKIIKNDTTNLKETITTVKEEVKEAEEQAKKSIETKYYTLCPLDKIESIKQQMELTSNTIVRIDNSISYLEEDINEISLIAKEEADNLKGKLFVYQLMFFVLLCCLVFFITTSIRRKE